MQPEWTQVQCHQSHGTLNCPHLLFDKLVEDCGGLVIGYWRCCFCSIRQCAAAFTILIIHFEVVTAGNEEHVVDLVGTTFVRVKRNLFFLHIGPL